MADIPTFYSNVMTVDAGPFDFMLSFGCKKDRSNPEANPDDIQCRIYLSPQHAKIVAAALQGIVNDWESHGNKAFEVTINRGPGGDV